MVFHAELNYSMSWFIKCIGHFFSEYFEIWLTKKVASKWEEMEKRQLNVGSGKIKNLQSWEKESLGWNINLDFKVLEEF